MKRVRPIFIQTSRHARGRAVGPCRAIVRAGAEGQVVDPVNDEILAGPPRGVVEATHGRNAQLRVFGRVPHERIQLVHDFPGIRQTIAIAVKCAASGIHHAGDRSRIVGIKYKRGTSPQNGVAGQTERRVRIEVFLFRIVQHTGRVRIGIAQEAGLGATGGIHRHRAAIIKCIIRQQRIGHHRGINIRGTSLHRVHQSAPVVANLRGTARLAPNADFIHPQPVGKPAPAVRTPKGHQTTAAGTRRGKLRATAFIHENGLFQQSVNIQTQTVVPMIKHARQMNPLAIRNRTRRRDNPCILAAAQRLIGNIRHGLKAVRGHQPQIVSLAGAARKGHFADNNGTDKFIIARLRSQIHPCFHRKVGREKPPPIRCRGQERPEGADTRIRRQQRRALNERTVTLNGAGGFFASQHIHLQLQSIRQPVIIGVRARHGPDLGNSIRQGAGSRNRPGSSRQGAIRVRQNHIRIHRRRAGIRGCEIIRRINRQPNRVSARRKGAIAVFIQIIQAGHCGRKRLEVTRLETKVAIIHIIQRDKGRHTGNREEYIGIHRRRGGIGGIRARLLSRQARIEEPEPAAFPKIIGIRRGIARWSLKIFRPHNGLADLPGKLTPGRMVEYPRNPRVAFIAGAGDVVNSILIRPPVFLQVHQSVIIGIAQRTAHV